MKNKVTELHEKYRPDEFDLVIGQEEIITSIQSLFDEKIVPHVFSFLGDSGTGKTTLAHIVGNMLGCDASNTRKIKCAVDTGKEDIEKIISDAMYTSFGENPRKYFILDECHMLSKNALNALLDILESPPDHAYFSLCTTEEMKIIGTLKSRLHKYYLNKITSNQILYLLQLIAEEEGISLDKNSLRLIASECDGNMREALTNLTVVRNCKNKQEVAKLLNSTEENSDVYDLCRLLVSKNPKWSKAVDLLKNLKGVPAESCRIQIMNYLASCVLRAKDDDESRSFCILLNNFSEPYYKATSMARLILDVSDSIL